MLTGTRYVAPLGAAHWDQLPEVIECGTMGDEGFPAGVTTRDCSGAIRSGVGKLAGVQLRVGELQGGGGARGQVAAEEAAGLAGIYSSADGA